MGIEIGKEFRPDPNFTPWGPFIPDDYIVEPITYRTVITASVLFGLTWILAFLAMYIAFRQSRAAREPWKSLYIWMVWVEIAASVFIGVDVLLYLLKIIRPSFWFYMSILLLWSIQIQLLLQIIVNRIRIILSDKRKGRTLMLVTLVLVGIINVSVFCIWIPARLQISERWVHVNNGWDRTEKVLFLILDAWLNYYFIRVVRANLIEHGLEKYNALVRFNQYMIVISLLMDVSIIAAMSMPNGFVYAMFHPFAYLVKLNIEMSMAHLIKTIALDRSRNSGNMSYLFAFPSQTSADMKNVPSQDSGNSTQQVSVFRSFFGKESHRNSWNVEEQGPHDTFTFAHSPTPSKEHARRSGARQNSVSWAVREDSVALIEINRAQGNSAHLDETSGVHDSRSSSVGDEISPQRPEPVLLRSGGAEKR